MKLGKIALISAFALVALPVLAQDKFISIGTGAVTGVYYPAGGALCRMISLGHAEHGIRCRVEPTEGSVDNVNAIRSGDLDFGLVQSDVLYKAYKGQDSFAGQGANDGLRTVFSLHAEPFTVMAHADSGITNFEDLRGKRVNLGNRGSGQRDTMEALMAAFGWNMGQFAKTSELQASAQIQAFCDDDIDAMVFMIGHPSGLIHEATTACDARLVNVGGQAVESLINQAPYYRLATIPGGMYRGNPDDVTSFGTGATLATSADMGEDVVYALVKAVFTDIDQFRRLNPAFAQLDPEKMAREGLSAPLHPGAAKYFREVGLIE